MAMGIGTPAFISRITTTPENAIMPPIDRSTPPAIRTTVSPIARMRKIDADFRTLMKLASEKKFDPRLREQVEQRHRDQHHDDREERLLEGQTAVFAAPMILGRVRTHG